MTCFLLRILGRATQFCGTKSLIFIAFTMSTTNPPQPPPAKNITVLPSSSQADYIHDIKFDYYGRRIATCSGDQRVTVYNLDEGGSWVLKPGCEWKAHKGKLAWVRTRGDRSGCLGEMAMDTRGGAHLLLLLLPASFFPLPPHLRTPRCSYPTHRGRMEVCMGAP